MENFTNDVENRNDIQLTDYDEKIEDYTTEQIVSPETEQIVTSKSETIQIPTDLLVTIKVLTNVIEDYKTKFENLSIEKIDNLTKIEELLKTIKLQDDEILSLNQKINSMNQIDLLMRLKNNINIQQNNINIQHEDTNNQNNDTSNQQNDTSNQQNDCNSHNKPLPIRRHPFRRF
jgi:hypothetical protein